MHEFSKARNILVSSQFPFKVLSYTAMPKSLQKCFFPFIKSSMTDSNVLAQGCNEFQCEYKTSNCSFNPGQITKILLFGGKDFKPCICDTCCLLVTRNSHPRIYFICSFFYFFFSKVLELAFTKCVSLYMTTFIFSAAFIKLSLKILAR